MEKSAFSGGAGSIDGHGEAIELDIAALRQFADEIMDEYNNYVKPEADAIKPLLAGGEASPDNWRGGSSEVDPAQTLGAEGGEYAGKGLGLIHAEHANAGVLFVTRLAEGLEAAALGTAVYAEELEGTDFNNSEELGDTEMEATRDWTDAHREGHQEQEKEDREADK